ncbi:MAG: phosphoribosylamine--glycine ligase [Actinobacteria bacterium]|nr:phosphoribosylamine--glycine ligase [Actinomycetota bacterium]
MKVLLVGSGGREHALAWKLARSPQLEELHAAPGNPGIAQLGTCHPIHSEDGESLIELARNLPADLVIVGPEAPLVAGVADELRMAGSAVFGPSAAAARIEGSKAFAKEVMRDAGVPAAETMSVARTPCVVKADGLAAGKGVFMCRTQEELDAALLAVRALGETWVIEELLEGDEVSVFAICDGAGGLALAAARDYKRIGDGDEGPNTGGMGAYSPVADVSPAELDELLETVHLPVLAQLAQRGSPFTGLLYAGLMLTADGPRVLEFNCRFGDPETQAILPRVEGDLLGALLAAARGDLSQTELAVSDQAAVTVVVAAEHYPESSDSGTPIEGIEAAEAGGAVVFHAGTAERDGRLVTNGGRILNVTATADTLEEARARAYAACDLISFGGARYRRDIAESAVNVVS